MGWYARMTVPVGDALGLNEPSSSLPLPPRHMRLPLEVSLNAPVDVRLTRQVEPLGCVIFRSQTPLSQVFHGTGPFVATTSEICMLLCNPTRILPGMDCWGTFTPG